MKTLEHIKSIKSYTVIEEIIEGYSGDRKFKLQKDGNLYLLRIGNKEYANEKKKEYEKLSFYEDTQLNTHKPIEFGITTDCFYSIVSWVNGIPVMDIIKKDLSKDYYKLGKKVGIELKKIHLPVTENNLNVWYDVMKQKASMFLDYYHHTQIEFSCSNRVEQYILDNLFLLADRPQVILHGDFHWNNCVVDEMGNVGVIDFSGNKVGDPWYEFGGLLWALEYSESFANGQIDGYFGIIPKNFWKIFKLYVALYAFEHLSFCNGTEEDMCNRICNATRMIELFGKDFELEIPLFRI